MADRVRFQGKRAAVGLGLVAGLVASGWMIGCREHSALLRHPRGAEQATGRAEQSPAGEPAMQPSPVASAGVRALLQAEYSRAVGQITACAAGGEDYLRANAVEAAEFLPQHGEAIISAALDDPSAAVRFAALASIGRLRLAPLASSASRHLGDANASVRAAAIFALSRNQLPVDPSPLGLMLRSGDPAVRGNAAMLVGLMGDPSAVPMLKELVHAPMASVSAARETIIRLQFAEAIARLGDSSNMNAIRAGAYSTMGEVQVLAVILLGDLQDRAMGPALKGMLSEPPAERQVAAAASLAKMGQFEGLEAVLQASESPELLQRGQAAMALGYFNEAAAASRLGELLADPQETVRVSAAAGLLRMAWRLGVTGPALQPSGTSG